MSVIRGTGNPEIGSTRKNFNHYMPQVVKAFLAFHSAVAYG